MSETHTVTQFRPNMFTLTLWNTVEVISSLRMLLIGNDAYSLSSQTLCESLVYMHYMSPGHLPLGLWFWIPSRTAFYIVFP